MKPQRLPLSVLEEHQVNLHQGTGGPANKVMWSVRRGGGGGGTGWREPGRIGARGGTGGGRRKGGKRDSQSGGNPGEKKKNFAILRNILPSTQTKEAGTPTEGGGKRE